MDKKLATKYLAFFSMTDGSLFVHKECVNASFHLAMKKDNKDILPMVKEALDFIGVGYSVREDDKYFRLDTRVHPFLTTLHERIYYNGRQSPSQHDFKQLDWEAVAIMYMCDGSIQKSGKKWYPMLNLCAWSYAELCWVKAQFKDKLGIDVNVYKCGKCFRLGVPVKDCDTFFEGVSPFITESFKYKLPYGKPQIG